MVENPISQTNFFIWKSDPVTKEIFKLLSEAREELNLTLTNAEVLLGSNASQTIPRIIGQREALDLILEIKYEDIEEISDENKESMWTPSNS